MQIGLHVSISGSIANAVTNAVERECSAFQIFTGNPRGWYSKDLTNELINILKSKRDEVVFRMKLTGKDEFDVLSKRVENLETKVNQLKNQKNKKTRRVKKS